MIIFRLPLLGRARFSARRGRMRVGHDGFSIRGLLRPRQRVETAKMAASR